MAKCRSTERGTTVELTEEEFNLFVKDVRDNRDGPAAAVSVYFNTDGLAENRLRLHVKYENYTGKSTSN